MVPFNSKKFSQFIFDNQVIGFFPERITLVSGRHSTWYVNWRGVASDVFLADQLSDYVLAFLQQHSITFDCIYGTPDGSTKVAVLAQYKWAKQQKNYAAGKYVLPMGRKHPKDHGNPKDKYFVGTPVGNVVAIEDVTNTGGSLLKAVQQLQEAGITVAAAISLVDRNEVADDRKHVRVSLKEIGVPFYSLAQALDLLPVLVKEQKLSNQVKDQIIDEFAQYGEHPIKL